MALTRSVRPRRSYVRVAARVLAVLAVAFVARRAFTTDVASSSLALSSASRAVDQSREVKIVSAFNSLEHFRADASDDARRELGSRNASHDDVDATDALGVPLSWLNALRIAPVSSSSCASPGADARERARVDALASTEADADDALRALFPSDTRERAALVIARGTIEERIFAARHARARAVIVAVTSAREREACEAAGVPSHYPRDGSASTNARGYATALYVIKRGHTAIVSSSDVTFEANPLTSMTDDGADVGGTIRGDGAKRARVQGMADPAMGWSQYAQSMVVPLIRSSFVAFHPTRATLGLLEWLSSKECDLDDTDDAFTDEILMPAHDGRQRAGVSFRLLNKECFAEEGIVARVTDGPTRWDGKNTHENDVLAQKKDFSGAKATVLRNDKCGVVSESERIGPKPRALRYIVDQDGEYPANCDKLPELCEVVKRVARNREIVAAVSNKNIFYMLGLFIDGLKRTKIKNYVVVALDKETAAWCKERDVPYYHRELQSITGSTDNHATSGLKFRILNEFVSTGTSVLLSDVDVVWMQDPFADDPQSTNKRLIYRDVDIEGMTDGWDDPSAYGFSWNGQRRLVARNSGMFFVSATYETQTMMTRLAERMATETNTWDQTAYNEEQVYLWGQPQHAVYSGVSQRVMNYMCFMNSKYFFRFMRFDTDLYPTHRPASVHVNYHPEKPDRMVSIIEQYWKGEKDAIDVWNWGEGRKGTKECAKRPSDEEVLKIIANSPIAQALVSKSKLQPGRWGGSQGLKLRADGTLTTPWNEGKWGLLPSAAVKETIFMDFGGAYHVLTLAKGDSSAGVNEAYMFKSRRCTDNNEVDVMFD